jgi:hypothetical protein
VTPTMKNSDFGDEPEEPKHNILPSIPQESAPTPTERDASPEAVLDRQNAASAKGQEAELAAAQSAAPQEPDRSAMTAEERLEARAEESRQRHAAEADGPERDVQEASTGRD